MRGLHMCELEGGGDMRGHPLLLSLFVWWVAVLGDLLSFSKKKMKEKLWRWSKHLSLPTLPLHLHLHIYNNITGRSF